MSMVPVTSLAKTVELAKKAKAEGKKIGLITGCFDIVHSGHVGLFRFAKKYCDYLIVGLETDKSVTLSKGEGRPVFAFEERSLLLSEFRSIDLVFKVEAEVTFDSPEADNIYMRIEEVLKPDFLFTTPQADKYWLAKKVRAQKIGAELILYKDKANTSSSKIMESILRID